jgi:phosphoribosylformimino-5-aminoimidazole carboxamide ribotide isomerase
MDLIPAIDLLGGEAVRLVQGDYDRRAADVSDPESVVRGWVAAGVRHLHIVDLDGARAGRPANLALAARLAAAARAEAGRDAVRVELGGGMRRIENVGAALEAGIDVAILGTVTIDDPAMLRAAVARWPGRIAVSVDVRGEAIALDGWTRTSDADAVAVVTRLAAEGVSQIIVTDTERDGTRRGPNLGLLIRLRPVVAGVRLVAAGGIASVDALRALAAAGVDGAVIGLALVDGSLPLDAALAAATEAA